MPRRQVGDSILKPSSKAPFLHLEIATHADSKLSKLFSRQVLSRGYEHWAHKPLQNLNIVAHHFFEDDPQCLVSLSHTHQKNLNLSATAMALASKDHFLAIGVDLEHGDRKLPEHWQRHVINDADTTLAMSDLDVWCVKEAAFKSLWPLEKCSTLKSITMKAEAMSAGIFFGTGQFQGQFLTQKIKMENEIWLVAQAWILK